MAKKPTDGPEPADETKTLRVVLDEDLAQVIWERCKGKPRGAAPRLANLAVRERFEELGWIEPLLKPVPREEGKRE